MDKKETHTEIMQFSGKADIPILLWLLNKYPNSVQFQSVARYSFRSRRTFNQSGETLYQTVKKWEPKPEGRVLYAAKELIQELTK